MATQGAAYAALLTALVDLGLPTCTTSRPYNFSAAPDTQPPVQMRLSQYENSTIPMNSGSQHTLKQGS